MLFRLNSGNRYGGSTSVFTLGSVCLGSVHFVRAMILEVAETSSLPMIQLLYCERPSCWSILSAMVTDGLDR